MGCPIQCFQRCLTPNKDNAYVIMGQLLSVQNKRQNLRVWLQASIKPSLKCVNCVKKATAVVRNIKRALVQLDVMLFEKNYPLFIIFHLAFSVLAWRPGMKKDSQLQERAKRCYNSCSSGI